MVISMMKQDLKAVRIAVLLLPSVYASGGHPGMPYARQNGEKCGLALVRQGKNQKKPNILAMSGL